LKRIIVSIIAAIIFLAVFSLYSIVYAATREVPAIITLYRERWDGEVVLCPPDELKDDVRWAVEKWDQAIRYFSIRFMLLDAMKTKIRVSSEGDGRCNVFFEYFESPERCPLCLGGKCEPVGSNPGPGVVVAYVNFTSPPTPVIIDARGAIPVKSAKIHLWRGLSGPERRTILLHEIGALLGIGPLRYSRQPPYRSALDPWGGLDVTSADVYAIFLKNRYTVTGDGIIEATTPWIIPYVTVGEDTFYTSIALCVSVIAAIIAYLALSGRWEVAG
jgi:hypothetical protein